MQVEVQIKRICNLTVILQKWTYRMSPDDMRELESTINRIKLNDRSRFPRNDGTVFQNTPQIGNPNSQRLNTSETYKEWTVKTPGVSNRGERRIVVSNQTGRAYYSHDHYHDFIEIDLSGWR